VTVGSALSCAEPRLVGLTEGQARRRLEQADCGIAVRHVHSGKNRRGRVVRVSGRLGQTYAAGHKVRVYIGA
jgi:beta-lactam-binding protein with PASTA domain